MAIPHISSVAPATGTNAGGEEVEIDGSLLLHVKQVLFGTTQALIKGTPTAVKVIAVTPAGSTGTVKVTVIDDEGNQSNGVDFNYTSSAD